MNRELLPIAQAVKNVMNEVAALKKKIQKIDELLAQHIAEPHKEVFLGSPPVQPQEPIPPQTKRLRRMANYEAKSGD